MKRQSSIEINRFTNFLKQGAFLRKHGVWTFLSDPEEVASEGGASTLKTDFLSSVISKKNYKNQWDMTARQLHRVLDLLDEAEAVDREKFIIEWTPVDQSLFAKAFDLAQEALHAGKIQKVVPIALQIGTANQTVSLQNKRYWLRQLAKLPDRLFPYGEWEQETGFMGATPEILFQKKSSALETMALAGTSAKEVPIAHFLHDPKERKEHQIVVNDIVERLSPMAHVRVGATGVIEFPLLNHLETPIYAQLLNAFSVEDLIHRLHPTPALGIYPRNNYFQEFSQYPLQDRRGFFGAPWGIETTQSTLMLVSIRKWDWQGQDIQIFAGCGVVQESVMEKEFAEILKKIDSVKRIFFQE
ncbi:MAG: chorismate-binding protein [Bdellovibrionaceae bacterium]|nr:chorismate-binding protein [Pseudobdellovibrionaceae bacterium]